MTTRQVRIAVSGTRSKHRVAIRTIRFEGDTLPEIVVAADGTEYEYLGDSWLTYVPVLWPSEDPEDPEDDETE